MDNPFDVQSKRGSLWHRWDPHIHTPGTALNDQYTGSDPWESFLCAIETSSPPIRALGITDYFGIERYEEVVNAQREGRLAKRQSAWRVRFRFAHSGMRARLPDAR